MNGDAVPAPGDRGSAARGPTPAPVPGRGPRLPGPSDPGLAGERTSLAWTRMGLTLLGVPSAMLTFAMHRSVVASAASALAAVLGLILLVTSLRRHRTAAAMLEVEGPHLAAEQVTLTAVCVLLLCLAGLLLIV